MVISNFKFRVLVDFHTSVSSVIIIVVSSVFIIVVAPPASLLVLAPLLRPTVSAGSAQAMGGRSGSTRCLVSAKPPLVQAKLSLLYNLHRDMDTNQTELANRCPISVPFRTLVKNLQRRFQPRRSVEVDFQMLVIGWWLVAPSHQGFYGAKLHRLNPCLLVTAGPIVQECCFARFAHDDFIAASLSHYAVSSIDGSSQSRIGGLPDLLVAGTFVQDCGFARFSNSITAACSSHYAISSIDGSSQSQLCELHTGVVPNQPEAFYLLSDVCSHTFWLSEFDDCMLRSTLVTNCWARHGNVEFRGLDPIKPPALFSNLIIGASLEVKIELEIHLVSSVSFVGFKADCACFNVILSQIGLRPLNVVYGSGASHLKFLPVNIPTSSYRCFNIVFDYQLFFQTINMGTKVEFPFGFLHFAEHDSPLDGSIFSCFVMVSSFFLPSSMAPESSASVVNVDAL